MTFKEKIEEYSDIHCDNCLHRYYCSEENEVLFKEEDYFRRLKFCSEWESSEIEKINSMEELK